MKHSIFSFFSGAGFLDLGFEKSNFDTVYVNEIHSPFLSINKYSRNKLKIPEPIYGYYDQSIELLFQEKNKLLLSQYIKKEKKKNRVVGFIGGPPCPDFSVGGKNKGRHGDNGKLSKSYIELITAHKPEFFLFENVKGLWRTIKHRKFYDELKNQLIQNNYLLSEQLINAIEFGVPQDRDRIILFGVNRKYIKNYKGKYLDDFKWDKYKKFPGNEAFLHKWPSTNKFKEDSILRKPKNIIDELTVEYWFKKNKVSNHPNCSHYFKPRAGLTRFLSVDEGDDSKKSYKRLHRWRYSPTVAYGNNEVHLHPYKARRLTVSESLSLQSLPLKFSLPDSLSLTDMFKAVGNGVPYLASLGLAKTIKNYLEKKL